MMINVYADQREIQIYAITLVLYLFLTCHVKTRVNVETDQARCCVSLVHARLIDSGRRHQDIS
jgi:hypothetical protein